ncbi:heme peroxidase [Pluteus cervinus]|uniref:Heme peroxidase n=1 Tax=Pluteus cervinus TaxID=181527 RepID=A0ACD3AD78_9AGAR|nr:heme peroxidase [Pluteus cervinus]
MAANITPIQVFGLGADLVYLAGRPLPTAPDGEYDWATSAQANASPQAHSSITNLINEIKTIVSKGFVEPSPKVVNAFLDTVLNSGAVDDRKGAFANGLDLLSKLPPSSVTAKKLSDAAIASLYETLPHPPVTYIGPKNAFRQADGRGNNVDFPSLGQAGYEYARSVQGKYCVAPTSLPDPGLVFDTLLKRQKAQNHPGGNSSMTFAFASLVTHSLFRTDYHDMNVNNTSSYLDLSPLYGYNQDSQDQVRDKESGKGLLYPDTFSEERLLFLPPTASALLVILSRNHNYVADKLLKINERGLWTDPPPSDPAARQLQDEQIFQTAKLVKNRDLNVKFSCGHFMGLIMGDYVAGFLGLSEGNAWNLPAFDPITLLNGKEIERGRGNHCSVEFNVLYRWHATTSVADEKWTEDMFKGLGKAWDQITTKDFVQFFGGEIRAALKKSPKDRTFGGLKRGPDGKFNDDDIANILHDATENSANTYGAQSTPEVLRVIEIMGLQQARQWGVCTMNEFRQYLGLKQFSTFEEWNPDPDVATGLQCEAVMPLSAGLRFAAGYTMTRAVLGDAIALVRGDRFYTTDFTAANLTVWGYQDCQRDPQNGGLGGEMPKLLSRHLPRYFPYNSVYTCFPFFTPTKMKESLTRQGTVARYTFNRPVTAVVPKVLNTFTAIKTVFNDPAKFHTVYEMQALGNGYGFMLIFDVPAKHDPDRALALHALFPTTQSLDDYNKWYKDSVTQKIKDKSWTYKGVSGNYVDIVTDVINATSVHWAADRLCGIPLKTKENPRGLYTVQEVYNMFALIFQLTFLAIGDNEHGFSLRTAAIQIGGVLQALIAKAILEVAPPKPAGGSGGASGGLISHVESELSGAFSRFIGYAEAERADPASKPYYPFLKKLTETGRATNELVGMVVGLAIGSSVNYAQGAVFFDKLPRIAAVHVVDFYFDDAREKERLAILKLVQTESDANTKVIRGYVREAMRLNPQYTGLWRDAAVDATIAQGAGLPPIQIKTGDRIWASFKNAHLNPADFPNPSSVDPTRPESSYNLNGTGFHTCPGVTYAVQTIAEIVKVVFKLKNVRRAPGNAGQLAGFTEVINETKTNVFIKPNGTLSPWPGSLVLEYDS